MKHQGSVRGPRQCPVQSVAMAVMNLTLNDSGRELENPSTQMSDPQMHMFRLRVGRGNDADMEEMVLLLPGVPTLGLLEGSGGLEDIRKLLRIAHAGAVPAVFWPQPCEALPSMAWYLLQYYEPAKPHLNLCLLVRRNVPT